MQRTRKAPHVLLSEVRLSHLMRRSPQPKREKLIAVRMPRETLEGIERVARAYSTTKAEAVVALLNEGLDAAKRRGML